MLRDSCFSYTHPRFFSLISCYFFSLNKIYIFPIFFFFLFLQLLARAMPMFKLSPSDTYSVFPIQPPRITQNKKNTQENEKNYLIKSSTKEQTKEKGEKKEKKLFLYLFFCNHRKKGLFILPKG